MINKPWSHIGINEESIFLALLYDEQTERLIAHFYRKVGDGHHIKSLYSRKKDEVEYQHLTDFSETITYEDVILAPNKPLLYINSMEARKEGDSYNGYDWNSLRIINLEDNAVIAELKDGELGGEVGDYSIWISKIHNVSSDGEYAICSIAIPKENENGEFRINYHLGKVFPENKEFELITKLNDTFL